MDRNFLDFHRRTRSMVASHLARACRHHQLRELSVFGDRMKVKVMRERTGPTASAIEMCWVPLIQEWMERAGYVKSRSLRSVGA